MKRRKERREQGARWGDLETGRRGDFETRRLGDFETRGGAALQVVPRPAQSVHFEAFTAMETSMRMICSYSSLRAWKLDSSR